MPHPSRCRVLAQSNAETCLAHANEWMCQSRPTSRLMIACCLFPIQPAYDKISPGQRAFTGDGKTLTSDSAFVRRLGNRDGDAGWDETLPRAFRAFSVCYCSLVLRYAPARPQYRCCLLTPYS